MSGAIQGFSGEKLTCVRGERLVFAGLDFAVAPGQALLLLGPNGSGKSSLLRLMAGLLRPAEGRLLWHGEPVAADPDAHRARLHYVGHSDAVKPVLTVRETVAFWAHLHGGTDDETTAAALSHFAIDGLADVPGRFLSAGQRRRTNLARLLAAPAPLWLLDEPTVGLDDAALAALDSAIVSHQARGGVVVAATHGGLGISSASPLRVDDFAPSGAPLPEEAL